MSPELLALQAATFYASGHIAVKFATQNKPGLMLGFLTSLGTGVVGLGILTVTFAESWEVSIGVAVLFALSGLAGPGLGRLLTMRSVRDVGTSVATPVIASSNPVVATTAGILLFNETVGVDRGLALALVIVGIWSCVRGGSANRQPAVSEPEPGARRWLVLLLPLMAGTAFAGADILRKTSLNMDGDPLLGAFIGICAAFTVWVVLFVASPRFREPLYFTRSLGWFGLSGLCATLAQASLFFALREGDLSVVSPIVAAQPVIVIVLGALLLREVEQLRPGTVVGAILVFAGVGYLSIP